MTKSILITAILTASAFCANAATPKVTYSIEPSIDPYDSFRGTVLINIDGKVMRVGNTEKIFGNEAYGRMDIYEVGDFNGDGIQDVIISDSNEGTAGGENFIILTYKRDGKVHRGNIVGYGLETFHNTRIVNYKGVKALEFFDLDLGQPVVRQRYLIKNGKFVKIPVTDPKPAANYKVIHTINLEEIEPEQSVTYDFNADGQPDRLTRRSMAHKFSDFDLKVNKNVYPIMIFTLYGSGTMKVLSTKTKGFHDLLIEEDGRRTIYKWDGSTYTRPGID